nr:AAA family ATPase [Biomaibacter acetigenes]
MQEDRRPMKIPYGISNFKSLREQGYLYVDKTPYIEKLENLNSKYIFFIRPRRFGKSLFLSTLEHYYDINAREDFQKLFGDLYIGKNPTPLKNTYLILKLNFSGLNTENKESLYGSFKSSLINSIASFLSKYSWVLGDKTELKNALFNISDIRSIIDLFIEEIRKHNKKIYLIIDEYDHFANDIIAMGENDLYKEIIRASGFVRDFYETVKIGTETVIDRIFITGISPIMLDDLTSGFNIAMNITMDKNLNEMMGFTEKELQKILDMLNINPADIQIKLKDYYNGYLFNLDASERMYNPDMIFYFLDQYTRYNKEPRILIDDNVKTDYGRLNRLATNEKNKKVLEKILRDESIVSDIVTKFSFDRMYDDEYFISLLFYMGMLTIKESKYNIVELAIPNYVIKTIFFNHQRAV